MSRERISRNKAQVWLRKLGFTQQELKEAWNRDDKRNIVSRVKRDWDKYPLPYKKMRKVLSKHGNLQ